MINLAYVLGTLAFFALVLAYVRRCERPGGVAAVDAAHPVSEAQHP